ncbi:MAG: hypothetical protein M5U34_07620 [Chloroflexi bacterium]|nr:hypothetical protein [Chloroflexota bacterium]
MWRFGLRDTGCAAHPSQFRRAQTCVCRSTEEEMTRLNNLQRLSQLGLLKQCTFDAFLPEGHGLTPDKQLNLKIAFDTTLAYAKNHPAGCC